jgi:hypothetical protein
MSFGKILLVCVILFSAMCRADSLCPWINKATALGALGTTEDLSMESTAEVNAKSCSFSYHIESGELRELRITVEQTENVKQTLDRYKAQCGSITSPLRAIGNEAVMCALNHKGDGSGELVIGRVRDKIFTITLNASIANGSSVFRQELMQQIELVAEQVAGNLF